MANHNRLNQKVFEAFPSIKTERLVLRELQEKDAEAILQMRDHVRFNEFIPRPALNGREEARSLVARVKNSFSEKKGIAWAGQLRGKGEIIGTCGFNMIDHDNMRAEIGGELAMEYWGKGIAQESVKAIIGFGFDKLGLHTIEAKVSPDNRGAVLILESLGFEKEAHYKGRVYHRGEFKDMAVYTAFNR
jgi:ribosomal-protein-alanine N-acetyltransferase